jgi:SsrA-binding protein
MNIKIVAQNKKASFQYHIEETIEAGLVLLGSEVKSIRDGRASLSDSYAVIKGSEAFLLNSHIAQCPQASYMNHDPKRTRKLLLHRTQIRRLTGKLNQRGFTLIPLKLYFKAGRAKVELGLCKGKKAFDKREAIKKSEMKRELARAFRHKQR